MRDQTIPVFYDEQSAASVQYANTIQGIRTAAARLNSRLSLQSDKQLDSIDFHKLPPLAILTSNSMPFLQSVINRLRAAGRHAVLAGADSEQFGHDVSCATPSRRTETQQLVNYLYKCGKEHIALMGFGQNSINDNFRLHAAMSAVAAWSRILTDKDVWLWQTDPQASFESFFSVAGRYDAVICPNDIIAVCFAKACKARGIRVPEDLFVASFGNMVIGRYSRPSITTMTMDMLYVGEQAFNVWHFLMTNEAAQGSSLKITVPSRILVRESTAHIHRDAGEGPIRPALQNDLF